MAEGRARRVAGRLATALGVLVVLALVDLAVGSAWRSVADRSAYRAPDGQVIERGGSWRWRQPAMAGSPWGQAWYETYDRLRFGYAPYRYQVVGDATSPLINVRDGVRSSWAPPAAGTDVPEVWFFGGSTTWGVGQRDDHTIASEVARLAAAADHPIRVVNLGQLGMTVWQEAAAFEHALATRPVRAWPSSTTASTSSRCSCRTGGRPTPCRSSATISTPPPT